MFAFGAIGLTPSQFWELSPIEFNQIAEAKNRFESDRTEISRQIALMGSWYAAALGRSKRMPTLKKVMDQGAPKRIGKNEAQQMKAQFESLPDKI